MIVDFSLFFIIRFQLLSITRNGGKTTPPSI